MSSTGELFGQGNQLRRTVTLKELGLIYTFHRFNDVMHFVFVGGALGMIWVYGEGLLA